MADLDAATRHRLADALAGADADTLREDAKSLTRLAKRVDRYNGPDAPIFPPFPPDADTLRRLAALALAVAEMQARHSANAAAVGLSDAWVAQLEGGDGVDVRAEYTHSAPIPLPAALAALLRTEDAL